jgi:hypothetical protein
MTAQEKPQKIARMEAEEEEGPLVLKFEPDFLASEEASRAEMERIKQIIDTLDISENKRLKLIRDLYRNKESKRLSKILVADTEFEDDGSER